MVSGKTLLVRSTTHERASNEFKVELDESTNTSADERERKLNNYIHTRLKSNSTTQNLYLILDNFDITLNAGRAWSRGHRRPGYASGLVRSLQAVRPLSRCLNADTGAN